MESYEKLKESYKWQEKIKKIDNKEQMQHIEISNKCGKY